MSHADDASQSRKINVLVLAEQCNPDWVSVPLVAWNHYRALVARPETGRVHLVTHERNREAIEKRGLVHGEDFTCLNHDKKLGPLLKLAEKLGGVGGKGFTLRVAAFSLAYPHFEKLVVKQFGDDLRGGNFDVVHQITPLSPT